MTLFSLTVVLKVISHPNSIATGLCGLALKCFFHVKWHCCFSLQTCIEIILPLYLIYYNAVGLHRSTLFGITSHRISHFKCLINNLRLARSCSPLKIHIQAASLQLRPDWHYNVSHSNDIAKACFSRWCYTDVSVTRNCHSEACAFYHCQSEWTKYWPLQNNIHSDMGCSLHSRAVTASPIA